MINQTDATTRTRTIRFAGLPNAQTESGSRDVFVSHNATEAPEFAGKAGFVAAATMSALALAPQLGHAVDIDNVFNQQIPDAVKVVEQKQADLDKTIDQQFPDARKMFQKTQVQLDNGYVLEYRPIDLNVAPKLSHGLGLDARGDLLTSSIVKTTKNDDGSVDSQGFRGRIHGEWQTKGSDSNYLYLEGFRRWQKPLSHGVTGTYEISAGPVQDIIHNATGVGVHMYQELHGGHFEAHGHDFTWRMEAHEDVGYTVAGQNNLTTTNVDGISSTPSRFQRSYNLLIGAGREYPVHVFGRDAKLVATIGPYFSGNQDRMFHVSPKLDVKVRW